MRFIKVALLFCSISGFFTYNFSTNVAAQGAQYPLPAPIDETLFHPFDHNRAALGRMLFYDPLLSGNKNISCATCHHPDSATSDGLALGIGEGGLGLGSKRVFDVGDTYVVDRVPRNSPALFNLGAHEFTKLFHDGRVEQDKNAPSGFDTPAEEYTPSGLASPLAAQALFPITSEVEMAGQGGENEIGKALEDIYGKPWPAVWQGIVTRLREQPAYVALFRKAYPEIKHAEDITITHYANAIADFVNAEWRTVNSPFDRYLAGDKTALSRQQQQGMMLFYGKAGCAECHNGPFLTDQKFHAIAMPQIGPGKDKRRRDRGRAEATSLLEDRYKFRTPSLRNVALTAPYGHSGTYDTLEAVVRHHLDPAAAFEAFSLSQVYLPSHANFSKEDGFILQDRREMQQILWANELEPQNLSEDDIAALVAFLHGLTDKTALPGRLGRPQSVPSGLAFD